jgi:hypothetical protein
VIEHVIITHRFKSTGLHIFVNKQNHHWAEFLKTHYFD